MINALQKDDVFLADVDHALNEPGRLHLWWLGQSGFLVQWSGRHLLFDPYLSDSLTKKYAATDNPHERMTERVVDPGRLDFIDVVTSTHSHTDHLDSETLRPLVRANQGLNLVFPVANEEVVEERLGGAACRLFGLDAGGEVEVGGFRFTGIPAAHNEVERDDLGRCKFLGFVVQVGPWMIYHSGDTLLHAELVSSLAPFSIDLAILPINGHKPERRVAGNMNGKEAARLAHEIGAKYVVPCHYEMFTFNTEPPDLFEATCRDIGQTACILRAGERVSFSR